MEILYKYVTHERALTCIPEVGDGTLRATQPAALNDPFECAIMPVYIMSEEDENVEIAKVLTDINESRPISEELVRRARLEYGSLFAGHGATFNEIRHCLLLYESVASVDVVSLHR